MGRGWWRYLQGTFAIAYYSIREYLIGSKKFRMLKDVVGSGGVDKS